MRVSLSDSERAILTYFRDYGIPAESRRAQIILMSQEDTPVSDIAAAVSLSARQVRHWRRAWEERGLSIFPTPPAGVAASPGQPTESAANDQDQYHVAPPEALTSSFNRFDEILAEVSSAVQSETPAIEPAYRPGVDGPRLPLELHDTIGLVPDDSMAEAGRKAQRFHFERMLLNEPGSRQGEDIEAVHDMRVATRRMRSAIRLFEPFYDRRAIRPYRKGLKRVAGRLGDVRDLDVFIEKAQQYVENTPGADLTPLFEHWNQLLDDARAALIDHLDSQKFSHFVERFYIFLTTPGMDAQPQPEPGDVQAYQVRHVAPRLIYAHYEQVRAYETAVSTDSIQTLHALRIDFKRLRYTLEFFEEVLGPEARRVIKEVKVMQDLLGDLHDAEVAIQSLSDFLTQHNTRYSGVPRTLRPVDMRGVVAYVQAKETEKGRLLSAFPGAWMNFLRDDVRRDLALAVSVL